MGINIDKRYKWGPQGINRKFKMGGWYGEANRHALAALGIKTGTKTKVNSVFQFAQRKQRGEIIAGKTDTFSNDFVQAEMSNLTNDTSNPWEWKKGEQLYRWTNGTYFEIVKVKKYPSSGVVLKEIDEKNVHQQKKFGSGDDLRMVRKLTSKVAQREMGVVPTSGGITHGERRIRDLSSNDSELYRKTSARVKKKMMEG